MMPKSGHEENQMFKNLLLSYVPPNYEEKNTVTHSHTPNNLHTPTATYEASLAGL